ncbi:MAG: transcriptional regulator [Candidatus Jettenia sp.]|uniref:Putative transcriptional regulator n=1 Tax=Candidatus Jettenia caeni TaxID=247490 RepID=I3IRI1_9BACT|nr:ATP-binding protein [Candidatus Jettenia sp. AMX1]MBC6928381.1 transcriptional regulator [Candidatus Jettenia sp.]GAB64326.1 putative transcriptional regulator [Candidatus Jettenia caeni]KAA0250500.1 MAG: transcriptional regulator [Candidatus Jettenia sp. AMX1]MCE7879689.1 transcriptional regulator [Candidatus Jettenia sp. AMX1]MCQ3926557.1 transcriptional regulator [Candidatus Jettenia sp.]
MNQEELVKLVDELYNMPKETEWVEFKENYYDPQEIGEYISALSNSACLHNKKLGYLVFGIENATHKVKGTIFKPREKKIGNEELESWLAHMLNPRIDFKIFEFTYHDLPLVLFRIDPPHHIPVKFGGEAFIRIGSYKKKLKDYPEKERKIWQRTSSNVFETEIAIKDLDADTVLKLLDYQGYFMLVNIGLPANKDSILTKLKEEKLIQSTGGKYHITNLGGILFARNLAEFDNLSRKVVRVIIYKGKDRYETIKEQQGGKGYAIGFEGLISFINDRLSTNEEIGKAFRKEVKIYPELAIRELVANALIHQDFSMTGTGPMIEIFADRIEISNPGRPLIDTLRFIDHAPQSRNEKLAYFMRRINICEERGSGIDKVVQSVEVYQLPAPKFIAEESFFRAILLSPKTLRQMDKDDKIRACYQHCSLKYVSNDFMTNQTLRHRLNVNNENYPVISRIIADTANEGLIKDYDPENKSRKYAKYVPFWA